MTDPFFERSVVLLWHHDEDGAIGVVVNRALKHGIGDVVVPREGFELREHAQTRVSWGGPVETQSGIVVTSGTIDDDEGWTLDCGIAVTRSAEAMYRVLDEGRPVVLCLGYAGWGPGQLDKEIQAGGWLYVDADPQLIFSDKPDQIYTAALAALGVHEHMVWMTPIEE